MTPHYNADYKQFNNKIMTQEVEVAITLGVDVNKTKEEIIKYFYEMEINHTRHSSTINRIEFQAITDIKVREESEIYGNE